MGVITSRPCRRRTRRLETPANIDLLVWLRAADAKHSPRRPLPIIEQRKAADPCPAAIAAACESIQDGWPPMERVRRTISHLEVTSSEVQQVAAALHWRPPRLSA